MSKFKEKFAKENALDTSFHLTLLLKGLFDLGEVITGIGLLFLTPGRLNNLIEWVVGSEISEVPQDWIVSRLVAFGHSFSISSQQFAAFYSLSHGAIKLVFIMLLWKKKLWAYPLSVLLFLGFVVYQLYRFSFTHSVMLLFLTMIDVLMIVLTILEYRKMKASWT